MPSDNHTTLAEEVGLTDADIDRALAHAVSRGGELVHQRHRRQAIGTGFAAVALVAGGFGVVRSLADGPGIVGPAGGNTTTTAVKLEPIGFSRAVWHNNASGRDIVTLTNTSGTLTPTTTPEAGDVQIGTASSMVSPADILRFTIDGSRVHVEFACLRNTFDHIDKIAYDRDATTMWIEATITNDTANGPSCDNASGATIDIDLTDGKLPPDAQIISDRVDPRG